MSLANKRWKPEFVSSGTFTEHMKHERHFISTVHRNWTHGQTMSVRWQCPFQHTDTQTQNQAVTNTTHSVVWENPTGPCRLLTSVASWNTDYDLYLPTSMSGLINAFVRMGANPRSQVQPLVKNLKPEECRLLQEEINVHCSNTLCGFNTLGSNNLWPHCWLLPKPIRTWFINARVLFNETSAAGTIFQ